MEKAKKMWKEISVFGIVILAFIGLFVYNKVMFADFTTISQSQVVQKMEDNESFVVVVGSNQDNSTLSYQTIMKTFADKNRKEDLYYVDLSGAEDTATFIKDIFNSEEGTIPQTFVIKDGEVVAQRSEILSYSRLLDLYKLK
jgi:hypothetical protein